MAEDKQELWAVVELFGHSKIAGKVSEQTFGGGAFVRVDVPEVVQVTTDYAAEPVDGKRPKKQRTIAAHTRTFGPSAIYSLNWCDRQTAILAAHSILHEPLSPYNVREALSNLPPEHLNRLLPLELTSDQNADEEIPG